MHRAVRYFLPSRDRTFGAATHGQLLFLVDASSNTCGGRALPTPEASSTAGGRGASPSLFDSTREARTTDIVITSAYLLPSVWQFIVVAIVLLLGAVAWLKDYQYRTAVHWLIAGVLFGIAAAVVGQMKAPANMVIDVAMLATRYSCGESIATFDVDERGVMTATFAEVAAARLMVLSCMN